VGSNEYKALISYFSCTHLKIQTSVFNVPSNMQVFKVDVKFWHYFLRPKQVGVQKWL